MSLNAGKEAFEKYRDELFERRSVSQPLQYSDLWPRFYE